MNVTLNTLDKSGHRSVTYDANTTIGSKDLEREVAKLIAEGSQVFVTFKGKEKAVPVIAYDSANKAWVKRDKKKQPVEPESKAVSVRPIAGG